MKKYILTTILASSLAFSLQNCNSFLELKPLTEKPSDLDTKTLSGINSFLTGAYSQLQSSNYMHVIWASELYADNIDFAKSSSLDTWEKEFATFSFTPTNKIGQTAWETAYKLISNANVVIDATDKNTYSATTDEKNKLKGEALVLRAMGHFDLLRLFALPATADNTQAGIVLRNTPVVTIGGASEKASRATIAATYTAIIADLTLATDLLKSTTNVKTNKINLYTAKALLARVYLSQNDYENAFKQVDEIIKSSLFKMNLPTDAGMKSIFAASGDVPPPDGVVFQVVNTQASDGSSLLRTNFMSQKFILQDKLLTDLIGSRRNLFTQEINGKTTITKYAQNNSNAVNIPLIRLAEIYLIRAEAGLETNQITSEQARNDLNISRAASQSNVDNATTRRDIVLELIRKERQLEFFGEGHRWQDLRRFKTANIRLNVGYNNKRSLLKIPESEVKGNVGIEQN